MFVPLSDHNPLRYIVRPNANWSIIAVTIAFYFGLQDGFSNIFGAATVGRPAGAMEVGFLPTDFFGSTSLPTLAGLPDWVRLFTYALAHADPVHLFGNMIFLFVFGDNVEDAVGHFRYILFYALSVAGGGLAYAFAFPDTSFVLVGASGGVAGVIAAYLLLHPRVKLWILVLWRIPLRLSARWPLIFWVASQFFFVLGYGAEEVAWMAHVGGLATGALLILLLRRPGVPLFDRALTDVEPTSAR
jgi:membrane associated rhomboid family serine protease